MRGVSVLLASAGRRPYLVEWFQRALAKNGVRGRIIVTDADPLAPASVTADRFLVAPTVISPGYGEWFRSTIEEHDVDLAISLNDFELSRWASHPLVDGATVIALPREIQRSVEDKVAMADLLEDRGIRAPATHTIAHFMRGADALSTGQLVVKGRYGSASRGLRFTDVRSLEGAARGALTEVGDAAGRDVDPNDEASLDSVIVQPRITGQEYGLDVVSDFHCRHVAVLARRKIAMRSGETDRAVSVDPTMFSDLGRALAEAIPHQGLIDVDVILDAEGEPWVIDVNPRFGGGYPFSHMAGADVPAAYVAWTLGEVPDPSWLTSEPGVTSGKYVDVVRLP